MALQHPNVIDLIAQDPATNVVVLGMTEPRPWDGSDRRIFELQEKVNAYLSFALDGEMTTNFPQFSDKIVRLQLECAESPDPKTDYFIGVIREQIGFQGIEFVVNVVPELASASAGECCGGGGGCCGGHEHGSAEHGAHQHTHSCGCSEPGEAPEASSSGCCGGNGGSSGGCGCA